MKLRITVIAALFLALRIAARVTLAPGLAVPDAELAAPLALVLLTLAAVLLARRARRFRPAPWPRPAWGA